MIMRAGSGRVVSNMTASILVLLVLAVPVIQSLDAPVVTPFSFPSNEKVGSTTVIICTAKGSHPLEFSWFKDGNPLTVSHIDISRTKFGSTLTFDPIKTEDEGEYKCVVTNSVGSSSQSASLVIQGELYFAKPIHFHKWIPIEPPTFLNQLRNIDVQEVKEIREECLAKGNPPPKVSWKQRG